MFTPAALKASAESTLTMGLGRLAIGESVGVVVPLVQPAMPSASRSASAPFAIFLIIASILPFRSAALRGA